MSTIQQCRQWLGQVELPKEPHGRTSAAKFCQEFTGRVSGRSKLGSAGSSILEAESVVSPVTEFVEKGLVVRLEG